MARRLSAGSDNGRSVNLPPGCVGLDAATAPPGPAAGGECGGEIRGGERRLPLAVARRRAAVRSAVPAGRRAARNAAEATAGATLACGRRARVASYVRVDACRPVGCRPGSRASWSALLRGTVDYSGVGRRCALDEPDGGLDAARLDIGEGVTGLAGWRDAVQAGRPSPAGRTPDPDSPVSPGIGRKAPAAERRLMSFFSSLPGLK